MKKVIQIVMTALSILLLSIGMINRVLEEGIYG